MSVTLSTTDALTLSAANAKSSRASLFEAEEYFVLRAPLLPVSRWLAGGAAGTDRASALAALHTCWTDPTVQEAMYLASVTLFERLAAWHWRLDDERDLKLARAFYGYVSRMCTRPTPFGLFASVSFGRIGDAANLNIAGSGSLRRHTRLDTAWIAAACERLVHRADLRPYLRLRRNDCGHAVGDRWHYVDWQLQQGVRSYSLSSVAGSEYLGLALDCASFDGCEASVITAALCKADPEITREVALEFVQSLIDNRLLVPTLEPTITGGECLPGLIKEISAVAPGSSDRAVLEAASDMLGEIDQQGVGRSPQEYRVIAETLAPLDPDIQPNRLFHVDLYRHSEDLQLPRAVAVEVALAAEACLALGAQRSGPLDEFCRRFTRRYDHRRIPLLEVLDEETGIGRGQPTPVPSTLLTDVEWKSGGEATASTRRPSPLLARWHAAIAQGTDEIMLEAEDIPELTEAERIGVHASLSAVVTLLAPDADALQRGDYSLLFHGVGGPSAAKMLGRFCFGSPDLADCLRASLDFEARSEPDAIFAEIVHLPQDRLGNIVCRPSLREYEIPVLGRSGAPTDKRISLDDLDVEVRNQRVLLWSRRLGKRVIPCLSNAHEYRANSLGIYWFLCSMQHQGSTICSFPWGEQLQSLPRLPRVRYGRVVIAPARWQITAESAKSLLDADDAARPLAAEALRSAQGMPRIVIMIEDGAEMAIDFDNPLAVDALVRALRKTRHLHLVESALETSQLCAGGTKTGYAHEIILPLKRTSPHADPGGDAGRTQTPMIELLHQFAPLSASNRRQVAGSERHRLPGSDWLCYRIYGGASVLDRVLADTLAPLGERFRTQGAVVDWFFIRYGDPDWHLRLRFQGQPGRLATEVMPRMAAVLEQLHHQGSITRVEIVAYDREIERYGGPIGMPLCERWFAQDSRRIGQLLSVIRGGNPEWRWQLAAACLVGDMVDLGVDDEQRLRLFTYMARCYIEEFGMREQRLATLGKKYRKHAATVQSICAGHMPGLPEPARSRAAVILAADRQERVSIGESLIEAQVQGGELWGSRDQLLPSLVHMTCNRWFADNGRAHELVLYELIRRGLESVRVRGART